MNGNSIHTGPERDRLIPIKLQLGPGVEIIGGGCDTPPHPPHLRPCLDKTIKSSCCGERALLGPLLTYVSEFIFSPAVFDPK